MITSAAIARRALSHPHMVRRVSTPAAGTPKKPIGAFRGGLFGFLLGSTVSGGAAYYYLMREYKVSNELLAADIEVFFPVPLLVFFFFAPTIFFSAPPTTFVLRVFAG